jgi:regulator of replication initiation timing
MKAIPLLDDKYPNKQKYPQNSTNKILTKSVLDYFNYHSERSQSKNSLSSHQNMNTISNINTFNSPKGNVSKFNFNSMTTSNNKHLQLYEQIEELKRSLDEKTKLLKIISNERDILKLENKNLKNNLNFVLKTKGGEDIKILLIEKGKEKLEKMVNKKLNFNTIDVSTSSNTFTNSIRNSMQNEIFINSELYKNINKDKVEEINSNRSVNNLQLPVRDFFVEKIKKSKIINFFRIKRIYFKN